MKYSKISHAKTDRAALYIRLSKEDEKEGPSESVSNQRAMLEEFCKQQELIVHNVYIDDGWSGTNFDRPAFQRMLQDIEQKHVNLVITKDLSRLGRDYILTGHYMERYFPEHQVRYISLLDGIDTGVDSTVNDITPFRAIMNDMYAKDISKKISSVKHDQQRRGLFVGGKAPYGYQKCPDEKTRFMIDPPAAETVRRIFNMALAGTSCHAIAQFLNNSGIASPAVYAGTAVLSCTPYSGLWSSERVSELLQNETYTGSMVQGRRKKLNYKSKKSIRQPKSQWVIVPNTHEAIIDQATFQSVQALLAGRRHTRSRTYDSPLKGLIYCHECGYPLGIINRKTASGADCLYFICRTYQRFTKSGACSGHIIREQLVKEVIDNTLRELCSHFLCHELLRPQVQAALALEKRKQLDDSALCTLRVQIDTLTKQLDKVYRDQLNGVLDSADFDRLYATIKAERTALQVTYETMRAQGNTPAHRATPDVLIQNFLESLPTNRAILHTLIERIELTDDKNIILKFRFRSPEAASLPPSITIPAVDSIPH